MSKDNVLKKEFTNQGIQRVRNLIQGKYGDKTTSSVGYIASSEERKEGDVWEVDGKKWTIKDGIKQNITKFDKIKKQNHLPLFCPKCSSVMNHRLDKIYYKQHSTCYSCVIEHETTLKINGEWEQYQKDIKNSEIDSKIEEFKAFAKEKRQDLATSYVTEDGDIEKWTGGEISDEQIDKNIQEVIEYLENLKT